MIQVSHGLAGLAGTVHTLPTFDADTCGRHVVSELMLCILRKILGMQKENKIIMHSAGQERVAMQITVRTVINLMTKGKSNMFVTDSTCTNGIKQLLNMLLYERRFLKKHLCRQKKTCHQYTISRGKMKALKPNRVED